MQYMGQSIQEWIKKNLWKPVFKNSEGVWYGLGRPYPFDFWCILEYFGSYDCW